MKRKLLWSFAAVALFLPMASPAGAQGGIPVGPGLWRLHGYDPTIPGTEDLAPLRRMVGKATVVGLGEGWHTSGGFYKMKHRVFRDLVETMGFRVFTIESHWASGEKANRYVQTCEGTPEEAIDTHIPVWISAELRDLVQWMCEWNQAHPDDRVHYYGFDIQEPRVDGPGLIAFLGRIDVPEDDPWIAGIRDCENVTVQHPPGQIPAETHERCMAALTAIEARFKSQAREIQEQTSAEDFDRAKLHLLSLKAYQEAVFYIGTDFQGEDFAKGFNKRDEAMAKVFFLLKEKHFPRAKAVVWAANIHVARAPIPNGARPIGSHLAKKLGPKYVTFALAAYHSEIEFGSPNCDTSEAVPGSIEDRLQALGEEALLVDLAKSTYLRPRVYEMGTFPFQPRRHFNGILFFERSERMEPLAWEGCRP